MNLILPGTGPARRPPPSRSSPFTLLTSCLLLLICLPTAIHAAFINFDNCLPDSTINSANPTRLQFVPLYLNAKFDTSNPSYNLNITVYGNVTGQQYEGAYKGPNDPAWSNPNQTFGKIADVGTANNYTTLFSDVRVLNYDAWRPDADRFCPHVVNGTCPLGPAFYKNASNFWELPAFGINHDFSSSYSFATLLPTIRVVSGDLSAPDVACISANITPDLGSSVSALLTWLPAIILILKGVATLTAAIWSPWGSSDIFRWSSNYGRDEDLLRLVTPGFGDCLQYIQFITLTGALTVQYPGFYQPAVSKTAWSLLLFNESYVSMEPGTQSLVDGIYVANGTYGMTRMSQLIGMSEQQDIWACMAIWLLVIAAIVAVLCQIGFLGRWIYRTTTGTSEGDLRKKNLPFTLGNMVRLLFNFFILPVVALSLYQFVIADKSKVVVVAMAAVLLAIMVASAVWILTVIIRRKPRTNLFDDMPTVLLYGPLYNTYGDSAAPFAFIPVFITAIRGLALGVLQPSGIAQIIVLAICEVILILTLNGFRPFQGQTSMNLYHTSFAAVRFITVLLAIAFVPQLGVSEASKGWIGYVMLFLHACVLVFGFFLNSAQTLIEVIARAFGVGSDAHSGAIRGGIFNLRMLRKRHDRPKTADRTSTMSNAAMLPHADQNSAYGGAYGMRSRSMSASSQQLLRRAHTNQTPSTHRMSGFENFSNSGDASGATPSFEENPTGVYSTLPIADGDQKPALAIKTDQGPFYRPPRTTRKSTMDTLNTPASLSSPTGKTKDEEVAGARPAHGSVDAGFVPPYLRDRAESNENLPRPDYAVREVDLYYRGPALNDQPTRKLKTGPADPEGPVVQAQSWIQRFMFGMQQQKKKEPSKGFEVVRSSRMPPEMQAVNDVEMEDSPPMNAEPYRDAPAAAAAAAAGATTVRTSPTSPRHEPPRLDTQVVAGAPRERSRSPVSPISPVSPVSPVEEERAAGGAGFDFGFDGAKNTRSPQSAGPPLHPGMRAEQPARPRPSADVATARDLQENDYRVSSEAPSLAPIENMGSLDLPSRFNSRRSTNYDADIAGSAGAQNWLRAVDNVSWNHSSNSTTRQPSAASARPGAQQQVQHTTSDVVTRRTSSPPVSQQNVFASFEQNPGRVLMTPPPGADGEVRRGTYHRRAGDSITRNSLGASEVAQGQTAEIFGLRPAAAADEGNAGEGQTQGDSVQRHTG